LKPGTRIVSHDFTMGDWKPEYHERIEARDKYGGSGGLSDIYLWVIPAKVAGSWQSQLTVRGKPLNYELALEQQYQTLTGSAQVAGESVTIQNAKIAGDQLSFEFTANIEGEPLKHAFNGTVQGRSVTGTAELSGPKLQAKQDWIASRK
jgi:hypothetical protein